MVLFRKRDSHAEEFSESEAARDHRLTLTRDFTIELVPMKNLQTARQYLPAGAPLSPLPLMFAGRRPTKATPPRFTQ